MKDADIQERFYLQIQNEINRIEKKAKLNAFLFYLTRTTQILLTGAITIRSKEVGDADVILVLGTLATVLTAVDTLFQFDAKRNTYKLILFELRAMRADYVHEHIQGPVTPTFIKALFEKYKGVIAYAKDLIQTD